MSMIDWLLRVVLGITTLFAGAVDTPSDGGTGALAALFNDFVTVLLAALSLR